MFKEYIEVMKNDRFCEIQLFICHPRGDKTALTVIDNQFRWEDDDFDRFGTRLFYPHEIEEVIKIAREICDRKGLTYEPFRSRYCEYDEKVVDEDDLINSIYDSL